MKMTKQEVIELLDLRRKWGHNVDLSRVDLRGVDLSGVDLKGVDLREANLSGADLSYADLSYANLSGVDLREANLKGVNLREANLRKAKTDYRFISITGIGSAKRMTTYCFNLDKIWCGCFIGTLAEFEIQVKETHKNNKQFYDEYSLFIEYLKQLKENSKNGYLHRTISRF